MVLLLKNPKTLGVSMNLKAFRALQIENKTAAMIFDLTERFPRGPASKLRKKDYEDGNGWEEPKSKKLIGGSLGYDIFELYALCDKSWWESDLMRLSTKSEGAAMGNPHYIKNDEGERVLAGTWNIFKHGAQCTRRIRRLQSRLREVKKMVERKSTKNIYEVRVGNMQSNVACFGQDEMGAKQTFDLLLSAAFNSAGDTGLFRKSQWGDRSEEMSVSTGYYGPAHGPHEILAMNTDFSNGLRSKMVEMESKIVEMKAQIVAAEQLAMMVDNFTLSTCAAFTEDKS